MWLTVSYKMAKKIAFRRKKLTNFYRQSKNVNIFLLNITEINEQLAVKWPKFNLPYPSHCYLTVEIFSNI